MPNTPADLHHFLDTLAQAARPGDRAPTVRELMRRFGASQAVVQHALNGLKTRGLIDAQVGRGSFFTAGGKIAAPREEDSMGKVRSVLLLRRSVGIARGRVVVDGLQRRFAAEGQRVLEVSYTDPDHALSVLKGLPHFDACMVQSSFETIPIDTLAALRQKADVIAVDGAALVGADVDAVGMEWGEPLAAAIQRLAQHGHRRIAYATTTRPFLANALGLRRLEQLRAIHPEFALQAISVPRLPQEDYEGTLVEMLRASLDTSERLPFTALVAWGIENGARFRGLLEQAGLPLPSSLSVVLLGRADLASEHADFFDTVGCNAADQIDYLHEAITARWADPARAYGVRFLPVATREGASIGRPPA